MNVIKLLYLIIIITAQMESAGRNGTEKHLNALRACLKKL